jgi:uncharacterized protein YndB with AHSA1/START domain
MATIAVTPDQDAVLAEIHIAAPVERVFAAITDPLQIVQWWGEIGKYRHTRVQNDLEPGGHWRGEGNDAGGEKFHVEIDPPRLVVYTWTASWENLKTTVRWELVASNGGTLVKIRHSGFAANPEIAPHYSGGWPTVLAWMQSFVEKGETVDTRRPAPAA